MAAVTAAVVGATVAVGSAVNQRNQAKKAARGQAQAAIESAELLEKAGRLGEADILRQNAKAAITAAEAVEAGVSPIEQFADPAAIQRAQEDIIGNLPVSGAIADSIRQASTEFIKSRPEFNLTAPVGAELERQAGLAVGAATPQFRQALTTAAQQGLAGITDVSQIRQRGFQRLGDIAGSQAAQRASGLVGSTPELANLAQGAGEARLLGDVAGQRFQASALESLSGLGGQLFDPKAGLLRNRNQGFGASGFEGTEGL